MKRRFPGRSLRRGLLGAALGRGGRPDRPAQRAEVPERDVDGAQQLDVRARNLLQPCRGAHADPRVGPRCPPAKDEREGGPTMSDQQPSVEDWRALASLLTGGLLQAP